MGGPLSRLRQVCSRESLGVLSDPPDGGRARRWNAPPGIDQVLHSARDEVRAQAEDELGAMNHVVLTGRITEDPTRDRSCDGEPITVLIVAFTSRDERFDGRCEVEVPDALADPRREHLRVGVAILISGEMTGGGLWATMISVGEASERGAGG